MIIRENGILFFNIRGSYPKIDPDKITGEDREYGVVAAVKVLEGFGFIKCQNRDSRMFFHCSELVDSQHRIKMSDEVWK